MCKHDKKVFNNIHTHYIHALNCCHPSVTESGIDMHQMPKIRKIKKKKRKIKFIPFITPYDDLSKDT